MPRLNARKTYYDRREHGLCVDCGKSTVQGLSVCGQCLTVRNTYKRMRCALIRKPICSQCGLIRVNAWPMDVRCRGCINGKTKIQIIALLYYTQQRKKHVKTHLHSLY